MPAAKKKPRRKSRADKRNPTGATAAATAPVVGRVPQPHGGALNAGGVPGNRGGTGRPPDAFRIRMQTILERSETASAVERCLANEGNRNFANVLKFATERAFGATPERIEHSGPDGGPIEVKQVWQFGERKIEF